MSLGWRAHVHEEWAQNRVRVLLGRDVPNGTEMMMGDGTWTTVGSDLALPDGAGLVVPMDAVPALLEALRSFTGERGPTEGEVRVLREWLAHERARVDTFLPPAGTR